MVPDSSQLLPHGSELAHDAVSGGGGEEAGAKAPKEFEHVLS
jgi:hypothetical protein